MTAEQLAALVGREMTDELHAAFGRVRHCVDQLGDAQVWWRDAPPMNSVGNLLLHLAGNLRQWIISGVGGAPDTRQRQAEFDERGPVPKAELMQRLEATIVEASEVLARLTPSQLESVRRVQTYDVTGMHAVLHSVSHFRGHTQEIIHMTRVQLGDAYRFAWRPPA